MTYIMMALTLATPTTSSDPFVRCATKAIQGDFGKLADWQATGYKRGLAQGVTASKTVWLTAYLGTEPDGKIDRRGRRCTRRTAAATSIPENAFVWCEAAGELRQIRDTGSKRNDGRAQNRGASIWVDFWYARASQVKWGGSAVTQAAIIK